MRTVAFFNVSSLANKEFKVINLGQISIETFVETLSQENQEQLVQKMDFSSLRNAVTANAKQAKDMLAKYDKRTMRKKAHYAWNKDKRQDVMLNLSRSTNIYTTALVTILVHAIAMTNTAMYVYMPQEVFFNLLTFDI